MKKHLVLIVIISLLIISGCTFRENNTKQIPILMYHHISEDPKDWSSVTVSPEKFYEDMLYLKALGYNTITFQELIDYKDSQSSLPDVPNNHYL